MAQYAKSNDYLRSVIDLVDETAGLAQRNINLKNQIMQDKARQAAVQNVMSPYANLLGNTDVSNADVYKASVRARSGLQGIPGAASERAQKQIGEDIQARTALLPPPKQFAPTRPEKPTYDWIPATDKKGKEIQRTVGNDILFKYIKVDQGGKPVGPWDWRKKGDVPSKGGSGKGDEDSGTFSDIYEYDDQGEPTAIVKDATRKQRISERAKVEKTIFDLNEKRQAALSRIGVVQKAMEQNQIKAARATGGSAPTTSEERINKLYDERIAKEEKKLEVLKRFSQGAPAPTQKQNWIWQTK